MVKHAEARLLGRCVWVWHGLPCALGYGHPSPHQLIGEQPQFDAILEEAAAAAVHKERTTQTSGSTFTSEEERDAVRKALADTSKPLRGAVTFTSAGGDGWNPTDL